MDTVTSEIPATDSVAHSVDLPAESSQGDDFDTIEVDVAYALVDLSQNSMHIDQCAQLN